MDFPRGSVWRKWDLHVHTPDSIINNYGSSDKAWEKFIQDLESLPPLPVSQFLPAVRRFLSGKEKTRLPKGMAGFSYLAPETRFELVTRRLTADCSTIEPLRNGIWIQLDLGPRFPNLRKNQAPVKYQFPCGLPWIF